MKKIICISMMLFFMMGAVIAADNMIEAYIVNHPIYEHRIKNDQFEYPLISYNDHTYIAITDAAKMWSRKAVWNEYTQSIQIEKPGKSANIIKESDTALKIGKAVIEEYFPDSVTDNDAYSVNYATSNPSAIDMWIISVVFDPEPNEITDELYPLLHPEATVEIDPVTGNFSVRKNGVLVVDWKSW